jgi:hypothetical protein
MAGYGRSRLTFWGSGCSQRPGEPPSDLVLTAALGFASLRMNARCHASEARQGSKCFWPSGDSFVSIVYVMGLPGTTDARKAIVIERERITRSSPENSGA